MRWESAGWEMILRHRSQINGRKRTTCRTYTSVMRVFFRRLQIKLRLCRLLPLPCARVTTCSTTSRRVFTSARETSRVEGYFCTRQPAFEKEQRLLGVKHMTGGLRKIAICLVTAAISTFSTYSFSQSNNASIDGE